MPDKINYREPLKMVLTSNRAKCLLCGEIIESTYRHDFKWCSCRNVAVDGGLDYLKRCFIKPDSWIDMSETSSSTAEGQSEDGREPGNKKKRIKRRKTLVGNKRLTRRRVQKEVRIK